MIKPPSNIKPWDAFYSGDDAIIQLPDGATKEQHVERADRIRRALETGQWADVLIAEQQPAVFTFKPLSWNVTGELIGMLNDARSQREVYKVYSLAFLLSVVSVKNLANAGKVDVATHRDLGPIATGEFLDRAGCNGELGAAIAIELGRHVLDRARASNPLS